MFDTVLVANRGEIAVRIMRTLRRLGIRAVAVYSDADAGARHVLEADEAVRLGPTPASESYLHIERIVGAALATGAQAVHPGYGFLAENAEFASACQAAGLVFVGPPPAAIEAMGDKIRAKETVAAAGVPVVPGRHERGMSDAELADAAREVGFPVLLKPSAGGGGKGMRAVHDADSLLEEIAAARREARGAFGDDTLLVERLVAVPRHVEIQVLADAHGGVVHLGERECSLQRRHQKIVEECPSPLLDAATREVMGAAAVDAARACGYVGAGTVEFIVSGERPDEFFFMEMNTRLQVEHPVTEMVTGLDLVELQLAVAAGARLPFEQGDVTFGGHAVEARVYAEDPSRDFLPTGGRVLGVREPSGPGIRVDSALAVGVDVGSTYDPMLAKVVAWGPDRPEALRRLERALAGTVVLGVVTNVGFLRALLLDEAVRAGDLDTGLVERRVGELAAREVPDDVLAAAVLDAWEAREPRGASVDPWDVPTGWRLAGLTAWATWALEIQGGAEVEVRVRGRAGSAEVAVGDGDPVRASAVRHGDDLLVTYAGVTRRYAVARDGRRVWVAREGTTWLLTVADPLTATLRAHGGGTAGPVTSPMPGLVIDVRVSEGEAVVAGQALAVVEAMKMEHTVTAPSDGVVTVVHVSPGRQVAMDEPLVTVAPSGETPDTPTGES